MKKINDYGVENLRKNIKILKPLGFLIITFFKLMLYCVISDGGTITEESSILNFPAITVRNAHERPEGMDEGVVIMSGMNKNEVMKSIEIVTKHSEKSEPIKIVDDYDIDNFSIKIVRVITGYIKYVNRIVWRKV